MNLLYIPHPHSKPEEDDLYQSFRKITNAYWHHHPYSLLYSKYDFIYLQSGGIGKFDLQVLKDENPQAKICQWTGDCRKHQIDNVMWCYDLCDINYLAAWQPELYPGMRWLPHGVADWQFREINQKAEGIVFIGNAQLEFPGGKERYELCLELEKRKDFTWYGTPKRQIPYRETPDVYNKHKFAIGASIFYDVPRYFSNRTLGAMAAGCCVFQREFPLLDYAFAGDFPVIPYSKNKDCIALINDFKIDWLPVAKHGQMLVRDNFHYDILAKQIINDLENL